MSCLMPHYAEGLKLLPNDRTMRMCICVGMCVCVCMCNCDNGFLCRNFQLPLLHFMGSLVFYNTRGEQHIRQHMGGGSGTRHVLDYDYDIVQR